MQADKQVAKVEEIPDKDPVEQKRKPGSHSKSVQCKFSKEKVVQREVSGGSDVTAPGSNQTGMPDKLRSGLENLSGYDLSSVRVHYNSSKPKQIGALAYAQGTNIHIGQGQEKHLPHEGWHVVQQMQGRVRPTMQMKGSKVNDDGRLELEATRMGEKALSGVFKNDIGQVKKLITPTDSSPVQRNVGLEIEVGSMWAGMRNQEEMITGEHLTLVKRTGFRLENELSGKLEFIIDNPGARSIDELVRVTGDMAMLAQELNEYKTKKDNLIPMKKIKGGTHGLYIRQGYNFHGEFQATVGIHLSAIPTLFKSARKIGAIVKEAPAITEQVGRVKADTVGRFISSSYHQMSPEMEGLLTMVLYYLHVGEVSQNSPFPKGMTEIMAQTDFGQMFRMTPEASYFANHPDKWIELVCNSANLDPDERIFQQKFDPRNVIMSELYKDPHAITVDITRREWLLKMTEGVDRLTRHGGGPEILKSMGSLKQQTDYLGFDGEENQAVIVELRSMLDTFPISQWESTALSIGKYVEELNAQNDIRLDAMKLVAQAGNEANLYNTGFEQQAGDEVNAMAYEAYFANYKRQVDGLAQRAHARAELAADERELTWGKRKGLPTAEELGINT